MMAALGRRKAKTQGHRSAARIAAAATAVGLAAGLAACGAGDGDDGDERTLTVFAAASLQQPFEAIAERF